MDKYRQQGCVPSVVDADLVIEVNQAIIGELTRRGVIKAGVLGGVGLAGISLFAAGCKFGADKEGLIKEIDAVKRGSIELKFKVNRSDDAKVADLVDLSVFVDVKDFFADYAMVAAQFPFPGKPSDNPKFQARCQGTATAVLMGAWLQSEPHGIPLWNSLFSQRKNDGKGAFFPQFGPALIFGHKEVLQALGDTQRFTVDPYARVMNSATTNSAYGKDGVSPRSSYYGHYMLGTDQDGLYVPDARISRWAVSPSDNRETMLADGSIQPPLLERIIADLCQEMLRDAPTTVDLVADPKHGICRLLPVKVVHKYLGLPSFEPGQKGQGIFDIDGLVGGETYEIGAGISARYSFTEIGTRATVPTAGEMYAWVRDSFRNLFNNLSQPDRKQGIFGQQQLLAWSDRVIASYKSKMITARQRDRKAASIVPDSMITRLIALQLAWEGHRDGSRLLTPEWIATNLRVPAPTVKDRNGLTKIFAEYFAITEEAPLSLEETISKRLADDRVQINAFGAFVGAVANPEEANARIVDGVFKLRSGEIKGVPGTGSDYSDLVKAAESNDRVKLGRFAQEFLRVMPQGEAVLRLEVGATPAPRLTFVGIAGAMRDPDLACFADPDAINVNRADVLEQALVKWGTSMDPRTDEDAQSQIYLTHGFGRHKCLGRYASEMTMRELLRAVVLKGDWVAGGKLEFFDRLYASKQVGTYTPRRIN